MRKEIFELEHAVREVAILLQRDAGLTPRDEAIVASMAGTLRSSLYWWRRRQKHKLPPN